MRLNNVCAVNIEENPAYDTCMDSRFIDTLGKRIALLRRDQGMTQKGLIEALSARGVNISRGYMSQIEADTSTPSKEVMIALADALGTTVDFLYGRTDEAKSLQEILDRQQITYYSEEADRAADILDRMPPSRRREAVRLLQALWEDEQESERSRNRLLSTLEQDKADLDDVVNNLGEIIGPKAAEALATMLQSTILRARGDKRPRRILDETEADGAQ